MLFKSLFLSSVIGLSVFFSGCAIKTGNEVLGKMEKSQVEQGIVKGKSTKEEIKVMFGDPTSVDFDNNSLEKWTYLHVRSDAKLINYVPYANLFASGTNDTKKTLVILFDDKGIVKNYINSDAKGETKTGLFQ